MRNVKICRYCHKNTASSREHLIVKAMLSRINLLRSDDIKDDNIRKTFKNITCPECNNTLGQYEGKTITNLVYATVWKILAGNANSASFSEEHCLKNTGIEVIESHEKQLLEIIKGGERVLPNNTFYFDFDTNSVSDKSSYTMVSQKFRVRVVNEAGDPIEGASVATGGDSKHNAAYFTKTNSDGRTELQILRIYHAVFVTSEELIIENQHTLESFSKEVDVIISLSYNSHGHRVIVVLPLVGTIQTGWKNSYIRFTYKKSYLDIVRNNIKDINITSLSPYFSEDNLGVLVPYKY